MRSMKSRACGLWIAGLLAAPVMAGFTTVQGPASGEKSHKEIFEGVYGGTFIGSGTNLGNGNFSIFSNGTITATRVDDNGLAALLNMLTGAPGTGDDDIWTDGMATTTAEARFAGYTQEFGYRVTSFGYVKLFDVTGTGFAVSGSATVTFGTGATWEWARANDSDSGPLNNAHFSDEPSNCDALDHMVTYAISGIPSLPSTTKVWLLFWEDMNASPCPNSPSDRDFNDLVVDIHAVECVTNADCFSNGLFCDGNEVCVDGVCLSAGDPCSPPSPVCCEDINQCKAECCSDADCPSNGVFCDGVEVCVNGTCVSPGSPCSGGAEVCCEVTDICKAECCSDADCQAPNPPCEGGEVCNLTTGLCVTQPDAPVSTPCEADDMLCTKDHCNGTGQCVFMSDVICQWPNPPCEGGELCNPSTGLCEAQDDAPYSTPCEADKNLCTIDHCNGNGECVGFGFVPCPDPVGECDAGAHCVTSTGLCENYPDPPIGTTCDTDGNLCTIEECDGNGSCVAVGNVTCQPANPPCEGGETCDPATGFCVADPDAALSTPCEVESPPNLCTTDHCNGLGACVLLGNVMCQSPDPPCEGGQHCEPASGDCVNDPDAQFSTPCEAEAPPNLCTIDHCDGLGACVFLSSVPCQPANPPCEGGEVCNPSTGLCVAQPDAVLSTPCEAESPPNFCTNDHCNGSGLCVHLSDVVCPGPVPPCEGGQECVPASGECRNLDDAVLSTPCDLDANLCTVDHCNGTGLCVFLRDVVCQGPTPPCEAGAQCNPMTGDCDPLPDAQLSTPCQTDADPCTVEHCDGDGLCVLLNDLCGACCDRVAAGGVCAEHVLPGDCVGDQLVFYLNETCVAVELSGRCGEHRGACCDASPPGGVCRSEVLPSDCDTSNPQITWYKDEKCIEDGGTIDCQEHRGACCDRRIADPLLRCRDGVPESQCIIDDPTQVSWTKETLCQDLGPACTEHAGACCDMRIADPALRCRDDVPESECVIDGSGQVSWYKFTACADITCEEHTGACCDEDTFGSCQDNVPASQCNCTKCWFYKNTPCSQVGCVHNSIPTVSQWGLAVLTLLLLTGAKIYFGRRQADAG